MQAAVRSTRFTFVGLAALGLALGACSSGESTSTTSFPDASTTTSKASALQAQLQVQTQQLQAQFDQLKTVAGNKQSYTQAEIASMESLVLGMQTTVDNMKISAAGTEDEVLDKLSAELDDLEQMLASGTASAAQIQEQIAKVEAAIAGWTPTVPTVPTIPTVPTTRSGTTTSEPAG